MYCFGSPFHKITIHVYRSTHSILEHYPGTPYQCTLFSKSFKPIHPHKSHPAIHVWSPLVTWPQVLLANSNASTFSLGFRIVASENYIIPTTTCTLRNERHIAMNNARTLGMRTVFNRGVHKVKFLLLHNHHCAWLAHASVVFPCCRLPVQCHFHRDLLQV